MTVLDTPSNVVLAAFQQQLRELGLEELAPWAATMVGATDAEFQLALEQQPIVRQRFRAVFERRDRIAAGERVAPLTFGQVIDFERRSRELESFYGLPTGFIDTDEALGNDVSVEELYARASLARDDAFEAFNSTEGRQVIEDLLGQPGISEGSIIAFFIDPERSLPELQRATESAQVAAAAGRSQFALTTEEATALRDAGFDPDQIQGRAAAITTAGDVRTGVGGQFGALSREEELALLEGVPTATDQFRRRARQLEARFGGGGGFLRGNTGERTGLGVA